MVTPHKHIYIIIVTSVGGEHRFPFAKPARGYANIPNLVYKSLDVSIPYFSTITNFVIEMTLGHVVTVSLWHVVKLQWSR